MPRIDFKDLKKPHWESTFGITLQKRGEKLSGQKEFKRELLEAVKIQIGIHCLTLSSWTRRLDTHIK